MTMTNKPILLISVALLLFGYKTASAENKSDNRWYTPAHVKAGKVIYRDNCATCHGDKAQSITDWNKRLADGSYPPPPLDGSAHTWHHSASALMKTISYGGKKFGGKMPGFKGSLSSSDQEAVIAYFQNKWSDEIYQEWLKRGGLK